MSIFNSLGSNYDLGFVFKTLFVGGDLKDSEKLKSFLNKKYEGVSILTYKGREAILLALQLLNLPAHSIVAINGYTCFAVFKAITDANLKVEYLDINDSLNFSTETFINHLRQNSKIKVLIIQNTLGYPSDIEEIVKVCKERNIILIEDLAHSIGAKYLNGVEAGTVGDFVILSFSQDKMIDGVSGGALIIRNKDFQNTDFKLEKLPFKQQLVDRLYPFFTYIVRLTYSIFIGKIIHWNLKNFKLLSNPMGSGNSNLIHALPSWYTKLIYDEFQKLSDNLQHRQEISKTYLESLNTSLVPTFVYEQIFDSTNLRFPIIIGKRDSLIKYLKTKGIYVSDIWYDAPIAPKKYMRLSSYQEGICKMAEVVSGKILNLPTHKNISVSSAKKISKIINQWLQSQ